MATSREKLQLEVNARDRASGTLKNIGQNIAGLAAAYIGVHEAMQLVTDSFNKFADYEADMMALERVVVSTGRNMNDVYSAMEQHLGGVASKATIASGFLKGMTTTLSVEQINNLTFAIRDASIAMGEDFATQFPLIIKAIKQLNPAILDNIGVTIRLDQVNKKIREGFYGVGTEINEVTQQQAIYTEIMRQTQQFQGLEAELLDSTKGAVQRLTASWENLSITLGSTFAPAVADVIEAFSEELPAATIMAGGYLDWVDYKFQALAQRGAWFLTQFKSIFAAITFQLDEARTYAQLAATMETNIEVLEDKGETALADAAIQALKLKQGIKEIEEETHRAAKGFEEIGETIAPLISLQSAYNQELRDWQKELAEIEGWYEEKKYTEREIAEREAEERFDILHQSLIEQNQAYDEAIEERKRIEQEFTQFGLNTMGRFTDAYVDLLFGMQVDARRIFSSLAKDFLNLFIKEALKDIQLSFIPKLLGFLGSIFDTPANDRLAMLQGQHYAQFFTTGMQEEFKKANLGTTIGKSISIDAINRGILPQIENEAIGGLSILVVDESLLTGQAHGFVN